MLTIKIAIMSLFTHIILFAFKKYENNRLFYQLAIASLIILLLANMLEFSSVRDGLSIAIYKNLLRINKTILGLQFFILFLSLFLIIIYRDYKFKPEFYLILATNILSMILVLHSNHWILFFVAWEIFNMSLYALIIGNNIDRQKALSASMKYFTLSALSTAFLLLGLVMIYHSTGDLSFQAVYSAMYFKRLALPLMFIGFAFLFKLSAVPVHFWSPDLYSVTPLPITAFISNIPKIFYFSVIIILLEELHIVANIYLFFGLASLIIGSIGLAQQKTVKRFLAFSAIINVGYILIVIQNPTMAIYNLALYILPNINIFMILIAMNNYFNKDDIDNIDELSGFFAKNPFMTLSFVVSIFSIAGIPPLPGFFAKYHLLVAVYKFLPYYMFLIVIITSVIAVASYLRILYIALFSPIHNKYLIKIDDNIVLSTIIAFNFVVFGIITYSDIISLLTFLVKA